MEIPPSDPVAAILDQILASTRVLPVEALRAAAEHREAITPHLIAHLKETARHPETHLDDRFWFGTQAALYLLAQLRETRAYSAVLALCACAEIDDLLGETITEDLPRILAAVQDGDVGPIQELVEDLEVHHSVRWSATSALVMLVKHGLTPRAEVVTWLKGALARACERDPDPSVTGLVNAAVDLGPGECLPELKRLFEEELVEEFVVTYDEVLEAAEQPDGEVRLSFNDRWIEDAAAELNGWPWLPEASDQEPAQPRSRVTITPWAEERLLEWTFTPPRASPAQKKENKSKRKQAKAARRKNRK